MSTNPYEPTQVEHEPTRQNAVLMIAAAVCVILLLLFGAMGFLVAKKAAVERQRAEQMAKEAMRAYEQAEQMKKANEAVLEESQTLEVASFR